MGRYAVFFLFILLAFSCGCKDGPINVRSNSKTELLSNPWKARTMEVDGNAAVDVAGTPAALKRISFRDSLYVYIYPHPETSAPDTLSGTWRFNEGETRIYLNRSIRGLDDFEWRIVELTPGNLKTEFLAPNPLTKTESRFVVTWVIDR